MIAAARQEIGWIVSGSDDVVAWLYRHGGAMELTFLCLYEKLVFQEMLEDLSDMEDVLWS
jgi:hypothetical protein